jgi:uncharacterized repeat protein (TIGR03803 family)
VASFFTRGLGKNLFYRDAAVSWRIFTPNNMEVVVMIWSWYSGGPCRRGLASERKKPMAKLSNVVSGALATMALLTFAVSLAAAQPSAQAAGRTEQALYSFTGPSGDGLFPTTSLTQDSAGNLYGTTSQGGGPGCPPLGCGTAFKLSPSGKETILYSFGSTLASGIGPNGLVIDGAGNLYGTTFNGGNNLLPGGVIFEIASSGTETTLYTFDPENYDGGNPSSTLLLDSSGNLYGTTQNWGESVYGTIFKLDANGNYSSLYSFNGEPDGAYPYRSRLVMDSSGNLYGLTYEGGLYNHGALFELNTAGVETILYNFTGGSDGGNPLGDLVIDSAGNFYGVTSVGGTNGNGVIFEVSSAGEESTLYAFGRGLEGQPQSGVLMDAAGNLYGTTTFGGSDNRGSVYRLTSAGKLNLLYSFSGGNDGGRPYGGLLRDANGDLFGTTIDGGATGAGAIFAIAY